MSETKEQVAAFYEEFQKRGKYDYLYGDEARKHLMVRLVGTGHDILDVGCRAGNLTQHYAKGNRVTGADVDRNALKLFEERLGTKGHWVDVDSEPLPFASESFDVVVFSEVMEHVRFPQKALGEIQRVLRSGGRLVGSVPNSFRLRNRLRFLFGNPFEPDPSHLRSYSPASLRRELGQHFAMVKLHPISGHLIGGGRTGVPVFTWLPFRIRALFALDLAFECHSKRPTETAATAVPDRSA
jgi:2-polyprenyl-3-methyl-5-hydroxy-6-metoxy-1,4-benzoquinol methylase